MKKVIGLLASAAIAVPGFSQIYVDTNRSAEPVTMCVVQPSGLCTPVSTTSPLPTAGGAVADTSGTRTLDLTTIGNSVTIPMPSGAGTAAFRISGLTASGGAVVQVSRSNDGGATYGNANTTASSATASLSSTLTADDPSFRVAPAGATFLKFTVTTAGTGSASLAYNISASTGLVGLISMLPSSSASDGRIIGGVNNQMVAGVTIATGAGVTNTGTQRVALASDGTYATSANQTATGAAAQTMQGADASGTTALAKPVGAGAVYRATLPTFTDGQRADLQTTSRGQLLVSAASGFTITDGAGNSSFAGPIAGGTSASGLMVAGMQFNGATWDRARGTVDGASVQMGLGGTALGGAAATTVLGAAANQYKATAGNIASLNLVNSTVAGFIAVLDVAAAPTAGAAITAAQLKYCFPIAASQGFDKVWQVPLNTTNGIHVAALTSCTTYTTIGTAPVSVSVQYK